MSGKQRWACASMEMGKGPPAELIAVPRGCVTPPCINAWAAPALLSPYGELRFANSEAAFRGWVGTAGSAWPGSGCNGAGASLS